MAKKFPFPTVLFFFCVRGTPYIFTKNTRQDCWVAFANSSVTASLSVCGLKAADSYTPKSNIARNISNNTGSKRNNSHFGDNHRPWKLHQVQVQILHATTTNPSNNKTHFTALFRTTQELVTKDGKEPKIWGSCSVWGLWWYHSIKILTRLLRPPEYFNQLTVRKKTS